MESSSNQTNGNAAPKESANITYLVIGGLAVFLLLAGGAFAFKDQIKVLMGSPPRTNEVADQTSPTSEVPVVEQPETPETKVTGEELNEQEVEFDGKTFTPAKVTVKKGQTVRWANKGTGHMEVASAPHPTHTIYPEFDQEDTEFKDKEEFVFKFEKVGSWNFHNHEPFISGAFGIVTVTE